MVILNFYLNSMALQEQGWARTYVNVWAMEIMGKWQDLLILASSKTG